MAIVNEHMLSVRLRNAGVNLIDFYWLKEHIIELNSSIDYRVPDCMEQVKDRQAGLFGITPSARDLNKNKY